MAMEMGRGGALSATQVGIAPSRCRIDTVSTVTM